MWDCFYCSLPCVCAWCVCAYCHMQLWDIRSATCRQSFTGHESDINAVSVSLDCVKGGGVTILLVVCSCLLSLSFHIVSSFCVEYSSSPMDTLLPQGLMMLLAGFLTSGLIRYAYINRSSRGNGF